MLQATDWNWNYRRYNLVGQLVGFRLAVAVDNGLGELLLFWVSFLLPMLLPLQSPIHFPHSGRTKS